MARRKKDDPAPMGGTDDRPKAIAKEEQRWGGRLTRSKAFQAKYSSGWDENKRLIFNENMNADNTMQTAPWTGSGGNQVAYGWGLYEGLETSIYVQNPDILVSSRSAEYRPAASRVQQVVAYDFEQMDVKSIGNLCLLDTFINGYGVVVESVDTYHVKDEDGKNTGEIEGQEFDLRRIEPRDNLFDIGARKLDLSDSRYLFTAWYPTVEQLQNDPNITDLPDGIEDFPESTAYTRSSAGSDSPGQRQAATLGSGASSGEKDPAYRTICVWEVYDKQNHEVLYMTDFNKLIIGRAEWPVNLRFGCRDMFPHTLLYAHPVPGRFYPRPEAEFIAPQLREINITERMISEDSRTKFRKWLTVANIFTEDQKSKVTDTSLANALIYVDLTKLQEALGIQGQMDPASIDLRNLVVPIEDIAPKKDLYTRYDMLEKEIQHIIGYGPASRGGLPSTRSAREAMMINAKQDQRLDKRKDRINDFNRLIAMKHVRFLKKYMATERYAKVMPRVGQLAQWTKYNRDDMEGDFEFSVVAGSSTPKNTEVKKAAVLQMAQAIMPVLQQTGQSVRPVIDLIAEVNGWPEFEVDGCFQNVKEKAKMAVRAMAAFNAGQMPPEQLLNVFAQLLMAELTPAEFKAEAEALKQGQPMMPSAGGGPAPEAQGQRGDPNPQATAQGVPPGGVP